MNLWNPFAPSASSSISPRWQPTSSPNPSSSSPTALPQKPQSSSPTGYQEEKYSWPQLIKILIGLGQPNQEPHCSFYFGERYQFRGNKEQHLQQDAKFVLSLKPSCWEASYDLTGRLSRPSLPNCHEHLKSLQPMARRAISRAQKISAAITRHK